MAGAPAVFRRRFALGAVRCEGVDPGSVICMSKTMPDLGLALWSLLARNVNANAKGRGAEGGAE